MGTSDVLKVFKIAQAIRECNLKNFQNITSDHKSRNARAVHVIFCLLYPQQNHSVMLLFMPWVHITVPEKLFNGFQNAYKYVIFELQLQQLRQINQG